MPQKKNSNPIFDYSAAPIGTVFTYRDAEGILSIKISDTHFKDLTGEYAGKVYPFVKFNPSVFIPYRPYKQILKELL